MLLILWSCSFSQDVPIPVKTDAEREPPIIAKSPVLEKRVPPSNHQEKSPSSKPIVVSEFSSRSTGDSHGDYYTSGMNCRRQTGSWKCRAYVSYHPFNMSDLPNHWTNVNNSEKWEALLMSDAIQTLLKQDKTQDNPKHRPPKRGTNNRFTLRWDTGKHTIDKADAPTELLALWVDMNTISKTIIIQQPRYKLTMGNQERIGQHEMGWLDSETALQLTACQQNQAIIQMLKSGSVVAEKTVTRGNDSEWRAGGFQIDIHLFRCSRQKFVLFTPTRQQ